MNNTTKLYSYAEINQPAKTVNQKPVQAAPVNPYQKAMYECGEALL